MRCGGVFNKYFAAFTGKSDSEKFGKSLEN